MSKIIRSATLEKNPYIISPTGNANGTETEKRSISDQLEVNDKADSKKVVVDESERKLLAYANEIDQLINENAALKKELKSVDDQRSTIFEKAKAEGRELGKIEGIEIAKKELREAASRLRDVINQLESKYDEIVELGEETLVEALYLCTAKIVGHELARKDVAEGVVKNTLHNVLQSSYITVRVAPEDYELYTDIGSQLDQQKVTDRFSIVPDERIHFGGCIIEHDGGVLDARLENQFLRLKELLISAREQRKAEQGIG